MTADVGIEPMQVLNLPSLVSLEGDASSLTAALRSATIEFEATVAFDGSQELTMDWVESGDRVCHVNGVCDALYYDAETLDVPVVLGADVDIATMRTPWDAFLEPEPAIVFARPNAQEYAIKRWFDLDVEVAELPFTGLADATHSRSSRPILRSCRGGSISRSCSAGRSAWPTANRASPPHRSAEPAGAFRSNSP